MVPIHQGLDANAGVPDFGNAGDRVLSANLKDIVQEIVNNGAWASGNALSILFSGTGDRQVRTTVQIATAGSTPGDATFRVLREVTRRRGATRGFRSPR